MSDGARLPDGPPTVRGFRARYYGGPADGRDETITPVRGESIDVRRVAIPPAPSLTVYATGEAPSADVALYRATQYAGYEVTAAYAALHGALAGRVITEVRYEYVRTEKLW